MSGLENVITHRFDNVRDFDSAHIFECGQCFRWDLQPDGSYIGVVLSSLVQAVYDAEKTALELHIIATRDEKLARSETAWRRYFDLDFDYANLKKEFSAKDEILRKAIAHGGGIRILNQQPYETIISFIISQNNNITRIKRNIRELSECFGEYIGTFAGKRFYDFPSPEMLASVDVSALADIKLGYRAEYIIAASSELTGEKSLLPEIMRLSSDEAFSALLKLQGVGPKVANCILLFAFGRKEVFPVDVWVRRTMCELYGFSETDLRGMKEYAARHFGAYGGIAQQYLFFYMREKFRR